LPTTKAGLLHFCVFTFYERHNQPCSCAYASKFDARVSITDWHISAAHCERNSWHLQELSA